MDILPTTNTVIREAYSRLEVKQTIQHEMESASGSSGDSVFISQYLSYEEYTAGGGVDDGSAGEVGESSFQDFGYTFLEIIRNRVKMLLEELNGRRDDSSSPADGAWKAPDISYYSAEQTAERIVGFALSFYSGGDRAEFAAMAGEAVMKGYTEALDAMGGVLPGAASDTISLVMDRLQQFASGADVNAVV